MSTFENYFDTAAATPLLPEVFAAMQPYLGAQFYNASALYLGARANRQALEQARASVANLLGARPTEIVFTAGGSEANNTVIHGIMQRYNDAEILTSTIEHESVLAPAALYRHTSANVDAKGVVSTQDVARKITDKTVLVSIQLVNNEVGSIQPIRAIAALIRSVLNERKAKGNTLPLYFHTDACQAVNYLDIQVHRLGVDCMTINSGKIYGPKQTGALFIASGVDLQPLIYGGGQEWGLRSGTENLANIVGFATALRVVRADYKSEHARLSKLRDKAAAFLQNTSATQCLLNGPKHAGRLANNLHFTFAGQDNERLLMQLDEVGIQVATGSACSASSELPSHVLKAMGSSDDAAQSSIRITMGRYTTEQSVDNLVHELVKILGKK